MRREGEGRTAAGRGGGVPVEGWVMEGCCLVPVVSCPSAFLAQPATGCAG